MAGFESTYYPQPSEGERTPATHLLQLLQLVREGGKLHFSSRRLRSIPQYSLGIPSGRKSWRSLHSAFLVLRHPHASERDGKSSVQQLYTSAIGTDTSLRCRMSEPASQAAEIQSKANRRFEPSRSSPSPPFSRLHFSTLPRYRMATLSLPSAQDLLARFPSLASSSSSTSAAAQQPSTSGEREQQLEEEAKRYDEINELVRGQMRLVSLLPFTVQEPLSERLSASES